MTLQAEIPPTASASSGGGGTSLAPSALPLDDSSSTRSELVALLNIPESLIGRGRVGDIRLAYAKYMAYLQAQKDLQKLKANGVVIRGKVNAETLIEVFASKTVWYKYHAKFFTQLNLYPEIRKWLANDADAKSAFEVWGEEKTCYTFGDLEERLKVLKARVKKREKEKRKLKEVGDIGGSSSKKRKVSGDRDIAM